MFFSWPKWAEESETMKACRSGGFVAIVMAVMITGCSVALWAQQGAPPAKNPFAAADEKILAEVHEHNEIMSNLEYFSDMIGQRLTGSENLKKANEWTKQKFADYGLGNPHLESWTIAHIWTRGTATARILLQRNIRLRSRPTDGRRIRMGRCADQWCM